MQSVGIPHFWWARNLACYLDGRAIFATAAAVGCVLLPGFRPEPTVRGVFGDPKARVIRLKRRSKKRLAAVAVMSRWAGMTA